MPEIDATQFLFWLSMATKVGIFLLIFIFLLVGIRLFRVLGAVFEITESLAEIVETVNTVLWQPVRIFNKIMAAAKKLLKFKK